MRDFTSTYVGVIFILFLGACTSSLVMEVDSAVPTASTDTTSTTVGLHITTDFRNYVYRENTPDRQNWEISIGKSQTAMFENILKAVYGEVTVTGSQDQTGDFDLLVQPKLIEMQLATPAETGFKFFEAWLNYTLTVRDIAQTSTRVVNVTAYGKQNTARFQRLQEGLRQAIEKALRDAGAKLTVTLTSKQSNPTTGKVN